MMASGPDNDESNNNNNNNNNKNTCRIVMQKLCSILDCEREFPAHVRPMMRSRIIKFALTDFVSHQQGPMNINAINNNDTAPMAPPGIADAADAAAAATDSSSNSNIIENDDEDHMDSEYHTAAGALRSIIAESDHSKFSPFVRYLVQLKLNDFAQEFFKQTYRDLDDWLFIHINNSNDVFWLVDTKEQVRIAVHFFPELLSNAGGLEEETYWNRSEYAVNWAARKSQTILLVPLLADLGRKYKIFADHERGGLITKYDHFIHGGVLHNTLSDIVHCTYTFNDEELGIDVLNQLRTMNLFKKEDIREHNLLQACITSITDKKGRNKMFQFLLDSDPDALSVELEQDSGQLPLHFAATRLEREDTFLFLTTLAVGMKCFPTRFGFLFHMDEHGMTPFQYQIENHKTLRTKSILDWCFRIGRKGEDDSTANNNNNNDLCWSAETFLLVASDEKISLDLLYIMLQREPTLIENLSVSRIR